MRRTGARRALTVAAIGVVVSGAFVAPSAANAASNLCGSSYDHVGHYWKGNDATDKLALYADVYYSSSAKRNCLVISHAGGEYGVASYTLAQIRPSGSAWPSCPSVGCDSGTYK